MKTRQLVVLALAAVSAFAGAVQADPFAIKPGQYQTRVVSPKGKPEVDTDCIGTEEAKDIVKYMQDEGSEESCKLTDSSLNGKQFTGKSTCQGGGEKPFKSMEVKSDLTFREDGYSGTLLEHGIGNDDKPFDKTLKISAKRIGECKAP